MDFESTLAAYPLELSRRAWSPVGGGFSGATVWKGQAPNGSAVAFKQYPPGFPADRLRTIHGWVAAAAPLPFVPRILPTRTGATVLESEGRVWDLATWLPGEPDRQPSDARLAAACRALADVHRVWSKVFPASPTTGIPAVHRRLELFRSYRSWQANGGRPPDTGHDRLNRKCAEAFSLLPAVLPDMERDLLPWRDRSLPRFPCLCDVHAGHVLFTGDIVTGLIDYGAMKVDHPAVDLARYLGSAVTADDRAFGVGLAAYRATKPPVDVPDDLVYLLEVTGAAGGLANWILRLAAGPPADPQNVARRMKRMLARLRLAAGPSSH